MQETNNEDVEWSTTPWTGGSNNSNATASGKSPTKSAKDLFGHSNHVVDSNERAQWMVAYPSCKVTWTQEQCITMESPYISGNFQW